MATKNTGLKASIQAKDETAVKTAVDAAVKIHKATLAKAVKDGTPISDAGTPAEAIINSVHGDVPFSLAFDEDTKWQVITGAYVAVTQAVARISKDANATEETARIIATNKVLRSVGQSGATDASGLL